MNCGAAALLRTLQQFKVTCCVKPWEASCRAAGRWPTCRSSSRTMPQSTWNGFVLPPSALLITGRRPGSQGTAFFAHYSLFAPENVLSAAQPLPRICKALPHNSCVRTTGRRSSGDASAGSSAGNGQLVPPRAPPHGVLEDNRGSCPIVA